MALGVWRLSLTRTPSPSKQVATSTQTATLTPSTADWPICRNEKYDYEFKYPKGWYVYGATTTPCILTSDNQAVSSVPQEASGTQENETGFKMIVFDPTKLSSLGYGHITSIQEYYDHSYSDTPSPVPIFATSTIAGTEAIWTGFVGTRFASPDPTRQSFAIELFHSGSVYIFNFVNTDLRLAENIVATFRFLQ